MGRPYVTFFYINKKKMGWKVKISTDESSSSSEGCIRIFLAKCDMSTARFHRGLARTSIRVGTTSTFTCHQPKPTGLARVEVETLLDMTGFHDDLLWICDAVHNVPLSLFTPQTRQRYDNMIGYTLAHR